LYAQLSPLATLHAQLTSLATLYAQLTPLASFKVTGYYKTVIAIVSRACTHNPKLQEQLASWLFNGCFAVSYLDCLVRRFSIIASTWYHINSGTAESQPYIIFRLQWLHGSVARYAQKRPCLSYQDVYVLSFLA
jgi:hypothetical protein